MIIVNWTLNCARSERERGVREMRTFELCIVARGERKTERVKIAAGSTSLSSFIYMQVQEWNISRGLQEIRQVYRNERKHRERVAAARVFVILHRGRTRGFDKIK